MNGSENWYAGALVFALISVAAILKLDDFFAFAFGIFFALISAINLRKALLNSAQAAEEDHQRIEIQFQQLRSKVSETSSISVEAMTSVNEVAQILQEDLQVIRIRLADLDNLTQLTKTAEDIRLAIANINENYPAHELESINELANELKKLNETEEINKTSLQTVLKLLQIIGQMIKSPAYVDDLDRINSSIEKLVKLNGGNVKSEEKALDEQDLSVLKKIAAKINLK